MSGYTSSRKSAPTIPELARRIFGGGDGYWFTPRINAPLWGISDTETNLTRRLLQLLQSENGIGLGIMRLFEKSALYGKYLDMFLQLRLVLTNVAFMSMYREVREAEQANKFCLLDSDDEDEDEIASVSSEEFPDDGEPIGAHWNAILWHYELYPRHAKNTAEMGDLVFAHISLKKFVLINMCDPKTYTKGWEALRAKATKKLDFVLKRNVSSLSSIISRSETSNGELLVGCHPIQLGSWLTLAPRLERVRATFATTDHTNNDHARLHPELFEKHHEYEIRRPGQPLLIHLPTHRLESCLTANDLSALDTFLKACGFSPPNQAVKDSVLLKEGAQGPTRVHYKALTVDLGRPLRTKCTFCQKAFPPSQLKACSGCRGVLYCSRKYEKADWSCPKIVLCPRR